jgi:hypothetical protein
MSYYTLDYPAGYKKSAQPYSVPQYLLLCGGPSNASDRVVKILSSQSLNPVCSATLKVRTREVFTFIAPSLSDNG